MSDVLVRYNNVTLPTPIPYVSVNNEIIRYGSRFGSVNKITLNGQITGKDFAALAAAQSALVNVFSTSYKTLSIDEAGASAVFSGCSFESISFDSSRYSRMVPYTIELLSYDHSLSSNILEPKDEIKISAGNDGFGTVSHSVSAKGFSIGKADTAINSAKNFVTGRSAAGVAKIAAMAKLDGSATAFTPILVNVSENLNRLDLTYSLEKSYKFKLLSGVLGYNFNNNFLTSYSTALSSGAGDDFVTATVQGEIRHPISGTGTLSGLYTALSGLSPYSIVSGTYGSPNGLAFCSDPITFSVTEDSGAKKINFNASYDNSQFYSRTNDAFSFSGCYFDAQLSCSTNELTKTSTITVKGDIKCRGSQTSRRDNASAYLAKLISQGIYGSEVSDEPRIYDFANNFYTGWVDNLDLFGNTLLALSPVPESLDVDINPLRGTISVSATFNNKDKLISLGSSSYSIEYSPSNTAFIAGSSCNNSTGHLIVDLNVRKRERVSLEVSLSQTGQVESALFDSKRYIYNQLVTGFIYELHGPNFRDGLQKESSSSFISDSFGINNSRIGSTISASETYSFVPSDAVLNKRKIIKS